MKTKLLNLTMIHFIVLLFIIFVHLMPTRFTFLNWNLFLALLPFDFAIIVRLASNRIMKWLFACLWLLFFPNTMYMMTDFVHLSSIGTDFWQLGQYFNYAILATGIFIGVGLGILSLEIISQTVLEDHEHLAYFVLTASVSVLSALGIYLGRYLRLNSWDVFFRFSKVLHNIIYSLSERMIIFMIMYSGAQFAVLILFHYGIRFVKNVESKA